MVRSGQRCNKEDYDAIEKKRLQGDYSPVESTINELNARELTWEEAQERAERWAQRRRAKLHSERNGYPWGEIMIRKHTYTVNFTVEAAKSGHTSDATSNPSTSSTQNSDVSDTERKHSTASESCNEVEVNDSKEKRPSKSTVPPSASTGMLVTLFSSEALRTIKNNNNSEQLKSSNESPEEIKKEEQQQKDDYNTLHALAQKLSTEHAQIQSQLQRLLSDGSDNLEQQQSILQQMLKIVAQREEVKHRLEQFV